MYKNEYNSGYQDSVFTYNDYNAIKAKEYRSPNSIDRDNSYYFKDHSNTSTAMSTSSRKDLSSGSLSRNISNHLANGTILSNQLANGTILSNQLTNGTILSNHLPNGTIASFQKPTSPNNTLASIPRTPISPMPPLTPTHKMNGFIKPVPLGQSKSGLSSSKPSLLSRAGSRITLYGKDYGVQNSLATLGLVALLALVFGVLGIQLLLKLSHNAISNVNQTAHGGLLNSSLYESFHEVVTALTTVVLMLNLCCVLVCVMQCFFAAKLVKVPQGEERAFKYLKECASTRFLAVTGFFLSIPVYFSAVMLHSIMELKATPAIISTAILGIGMLFCFVAVLQSLIYWWKNKRKANENAPVDDSKDRSSGKSSTGTNGASVISQSELSTLV